MEGDAVKDSKEAHFVGARFPTLLICAVLWAVAILGLATLPGCAQHTAAPVEQPIAQAQVPISDQAAQGSESHVHVYVLNAPGSNQLPDEPGRLLDLAGSGGMATLADVNSDGSGNGVRDTRAGYQQAGITFNIQTGGSSTGPQSTGGVSGQSAQPGATVTQSPEQRPEATVTTPIAVALPGGAASSSGAGATGGGNVQLTAEQQAELRTALLEAMAGDEGALAKLAKLLGMVSPPPTTQPSE